MGELLPLLDANRAIVQFLYGQAFFVSALAIPLLLRRASTFRLAAVVWLFATFAMLHALSEWAEAFMSLQEARLPEAGAPALRAAQLALVVLSFAFLFQFGASLLARLRPRFSWLTRVSAPLTATYLAAVVVGPTLLPELAIRPFTLATAFARFFLLLPAAVLSLLALFLEARDAELQPYPRISRSLRLAAICLLTWAIVPEVLSSVFALASASLAATVQPVLVACAIPAGLGVALFIVRAMEIFAIEQAQQMDAMERRHSVLVERERIGNELHDGVAQVLYSLGMQAQAAALRSDDAAARESLLAIGKVARAALNDVRAMIDGSLPSLGSGRSLVDAIAALPDEYAPLSAPGVRVEVQGEPVALPRAVEAVLYRIAREAVFNAIRHGGASQIAVTLVFGDGQVSIRVEDNGLGVEDPDHALEQPRAHGLGLAGLVERLASWHGTLGIRRRPQGGTELSATIPLGAVRSSRGLEVSP